MQLSKFAVTLLLGICVEAGQDKDVEDLIARGFTCSLADTRYGIIAIEFISNYHLLDQGPE